MAKSTRRTIPAKKSTVRSSRVTVSGPAAPDSSGTGDALAEKMAGTQAVASGFPFNPIKRAEYDPAAALTPPEGPSVKRADPIVGASTVSKSNGSEKAGSGGPNIGHNPTVGSLDRVRVDATNRVLTTNQGSRSPTIRTPSKPACAGRRCLRISSSARRSPSPSPTD